MLIKVAFVVLFSFSSFVNSAGNNCKVERVEAERLSKGKVAVSGMVSKPNAAVSIEIYKLRTLIGTGTVLSNGRGAFLGNIYTNKKPYKRPATIVTCR